MKSKLLIIISFFCLSLACYGQQDSTWRNWNWLIGEWVGEGGGQPGQGTGTFSLKPDLDNKILVRKNHAEYPSGEKGGKMIHDDLMIVYVDKTEPPSRAIYFDNEGHTIQYAVSYDKYSITLTSDRVPDRPVFRLSYQLLERDKINVKFEMSRDGENFATYTEGKCVKKR